jgi:hypothetical protein
MKRKSLALLLRHAVKRPATLSQKPAPWRPLEKANRKARQLGSQGLPTAAGMAFFDCA